MHRRSLLLVVTLALYFNTVIAYSSAGRGVLSTCYTEYGCFTAGYPFGLTLQRPFSLLPDSPDVIDARFLLYTRESADKGQLIGRRTTLATWHQGKPTKILVHGFLDSINSTWWPQMKDAFLQAEDCNVILTDWSRANRFPYTKATANAQVVGAHIALLVNMMITEHGAEPTDFHVVGHSLGAAVAGYAGYRINGLGRITGLDPAGPFFENTDPIVRLDPSDARFVDIIHTDGAHNLLFGLGTLHQMGHVDFYPNGGMDQPSCAKTPGKLIDAMLNVSPLDIFDHIDVQDFDASLCSHFAAVHLFINSILDRCVYRGFSCESHEEFRHGKCSLKANKGNFMGYHASSNGTLGRLYLETQRPNKAPLCIRHYQVSLKSGSTFDQTKGRLRLSIAGSLSIQNVPFDPEEITFKQNSVETRYIPLKIDLGIVHRINIVFERTSNWFFSSPYSSKWTFTNVTLVDGDRQTSVTSCPGQNMPLVESGSIAQFPLCP